MMNGFIARGGIFLGDFAVAFGYGAEGKIIPPKQQLVARELPNTKHPRVLVQEASSPKMSARTYKKKG